MPLFRAMNLDTTTSNMNQNNCPLCGTGQLHSQVREKKFSRASGEIVVELLFSRCDTCESEIVTADQSRENKRRLRAREKQYDGHLTGTQIYALRRRYNLTQKDAAKLFGGGPVAFSKYESEGVLPSDAMNKLLLAASALPEVVDYLAHREGISLSGAGKGTPDHKVATGKWQTSTMRATFVIEPTAWMGTLRSQLAQYADLTSNGDAGVSEYCDMSANDSHAMEVALAAA